MKRAWYRLPMIAAAVFALLLAVASPSAVAAEQYLVLQPFVDNPTELIAQYATDTKAAVHSEIKGFQRLPASPIGAVAKVTNSSKATDNAKEVLPGGAAGVASIGIRGPTKA